MSADEFTKLFRYMTKRFDIIEKRLDEKADKVDMQRALGLLYSLSKRQETHDQEKSVMGHQLNA